MSGTCCIASTEAVDPQQPAPPKRVMARLDIKGSNVIRGIQFEGLRVVGTPEELARRYSHAGIDELIFIDTVASLYGRNHILDVIERTAEIRVGGSTIMVCDAKPHWAATPALLQVYVRDVDQVVRRARDAGAEVVTDPTPFHGGQRLARLRDPWGGLWWLYEYGAGSTAPSEGPDELPTWRPDPSAPPSYVHRTIDEALTAPGAR